MNSRNEPTAPSSSSSRSGSRPSCIVGLPIDEPVEDREDVVQKLRQRSPNELRRARQHHSRALEALENGSYEALGDGTRKKLVEELRSNLEALDEALELEGRAPVDHTSSPEPHSSSPLRALIGWLS